MEEVTGPVNTMNPKILCTWLGLPDKNWPPDHYVLLGLSPFEGDMARIEQQVQDRMGKLRCYQLSHPEEATEGMNRIAQAYICLTENQSKQAYDRTLGMPAARPEETSPGPNGAASVAALKVGAPSVTTPGGTAPSEATSSTAALQQTKALDQTVSDWKIAPPPVRGAKDNSGSNLLVPVPEKPPPAPKPADIIYDLAHRSPEARRGLGNLRALVDRIYLTRHLLLVWDQAGKYLSNPKKKLSRQAEETDLTRRLNNIFELMAEYPKIVGHPGQPGYRVVAMARLEMTAQMFKMLDARQREDLARDWEAGHKVLLSHRQFLRGHFKALRRRRWPSLVFQAVRGTLNDHPMWVLFGVALLVAVCAFCYWKVF